MSVRSGGSRSLVSLVFTIAVLAAIGFEFFQWT